jgi:hypothetical protein
LKRVLTKTVLTPRSAFTQDKKNAASCFLSKMQQEIIPYMKDTGKMLEIFEKIGTVDTLNHYYNIQQLQKLIDKMEDITMIIRGRSIVEYSWIAMAA